MRSDICLSAVIFVPALLLSGCVSGSAIRSQGEVIQSDIQRARHSGAMRCAPQDLALAEANLDFAYGEVSEGNSPRAQDHIRLAEEHIQKALVLSKDCGPKQVVIKEPEPVVVVKVQMVDTDADGVPDVSDACPEVPGPVENKGCPLDTDGDGILDEVDACPTEPGVPNLEDPKKHGCPIRDTDGDGILDDADACPTEPGVPNLEDPTKHGCPIRDTDGDGILDDVDACPTEPGVAQEDPKKHGCPRKMQLVVIKQDKIEIKQQINFATGKSIIRGQRSFQILDEVIQVLVDYPSIQKLSVEGHTDSTGSATFNQKLSQARAEAVVKYMVGKGIAQERLQAIGYGKDRPIAPNTTPAGRAKNRRTEFNILERN